MFTHKDSEMTKMVAYVAANLDEAERIAHRYLGTNQHIPPDRLERVHALIVHSTQVLKALHTASVKISDLIEQEAEEIKNIQIVDTEGHL